jgi:capsular exopolysaccharide synthesis family protein
VSISGGNPEELKILVNAVATAFVADSQQRAKDKAKVELDALANTLADIQAGFQKKEKELAKKLQDAKVPDPRDLEKQKEPLRKVIETVEGLLLKAGLDESGLQVKLKSLEKQKKDLPQQAIPVYVVDEYLKDDEFMKTTKKLILSWIGQKKAARYLYQGQAAADEEIRCQKQIDALEEALDQYRQKNQEKIREKMLAEVQKEIVKTTGELDTTADQKTQLRNQRDKFKEELQKLETFQMPKEISALDSAIKSDKAALERMQDKVALVKTKLSNVSKSPDGGPTAGGNISVLQLAETPQTLDRGRQLKVAGAAGAGMFVLVLLGMTLLEFRSRKINGTEDVTQGLGFHLVGTVPALPERLRNPGSPTSSPRDLYWASLLTESVDAVRTMLLHDARGDALQVIMVTSATSGEGKTSLAGHLAASLARAWKKTLLIDADLRNPAAHKLFNVALEPGFSDVLRGEIGPAEAVHPTPIGRLWMMPAGALDSHAVQALAQDGLKATFDQLKEQYDFIVVDSCPLLPVADSLLLAQHVDAVIFSLLRDVSRAGAVHAAQQRLERLGVRTLGAVMLGAEVPAGAYPYALRARN